MTSFTHPDTELSPGEEAARWLCELQEDDPEQKAEFFTWLRRSPRHVEEFLLATMTWKRLSRFGHADAARVERLIAEAQAEQQAGSNILALAETKRAAIPRSLGRRGNRRVWLAAAGLATLGAAIALWSISMHTQNYSTHVGEQRTVRLPDGSRIDLNAKSHIAVAFSAKARDIRLLEGEALFTVAKDAARPFQVDTSDAVVRAVGTQFNVYRRDSQTKVSVVEGIVQMDARMPAAAPVRLTAGEEARVIPSGKIAKLTVNNVTGAIAWRQRRLIFRNDRLADVAKQANLFSARPIRIEDDAARGLRLTAMFDVDDPEALVRFLERMEQLSVEKRSDEIVVRGR